MSRRIYTRDIPYIGTVKAKWTEREAREANEALLTMKDKNLWEPRVPPKRKTR